jgi:hypothetical protein
MRDGADLIGLNAADQLQFVGELALVLDVSFASIAAPFARRSDSA